MNLIANLKLPHWAMVVLTIAGVVVTWMAQQQALGALVLPTWAASLASLLLVVLTSLGIASPSASTSTNVRAVKAAGAALLCLAIAMLAGCAPPKSPTSDQIKTDADFAVCVATDVLASKPILTVAADCGRDLPAIIAQVWTLVSTQSLIANPYASTSAAAEVRAIRSTLVAP